ncbi:MAG: hypothetical protein M3Z01_05325 [Thermoproteota archaeon]|nr:hypothetical protein [Thermoproteota archaeon]
MTRNTSAYPAIAFILAFAIANIYFFQQVNAQTISPIVNSTSSTGGAKVISLPPSSSGKPVPPIQLKSTIFSDLAKCISSRTCHPVMGSEGDDRITGGNDSSIIMGLGGNDIIRGGINDNIIIGGPGDNQLYGGGGNNIIVASGTGTDQIYGGNKSNILIAGTGSTLLVAGKGNDKLYGGGGNDIFVGGPGADYFACGVGGSKSVVLNFNAAKGDDTDGTCGTVLGQQ